MKLKLCLLLTVGLVAALTVRTSLALPQFNKEFKERYANSDVDAAIKEKLAGRKCAICHVEVDGKVNKKKRNPYGTELDKLLSKNDKKDTDKIRKALEEVEKLEVAAGKTWAALFESGEVPENKQGKQEE